MPTPKEDEKGPLTIRATGKVAADLESCIYAPFVEYYDYIYLNTSADTFTKIAFFCHFDIIIAKHKQLYKNSDYIK